MFETLSASALRDHASTGPSLVAAAVHGALIASAVVLARPALSSASDKSPTDIWIPYPSRESPVAASGARPPARPFIVPMDIPRVVLPSLPTDTPILPTQNALDRLTHDVVALGTGTPDGTGSIDSSGASTVWTATIVDQPARVAHAVLPQYPRALEAAGVSGRVVLEFVIDTTGQIEPASLRVVSSSHAGFDTAAREAVVATRFHPGRVNSKPVRQLARQAVAFVSER